MIKYSNQDIFKIDAEIIVNPVNCEGVMGKGLALEFKNRYTSMFTHYEYLCSKDRVKIGEVNFVQVKDKQILLFPTKNKWRNPSQYRYIERGLEDLSPKLSMLGFKSIAFPLLGCGLGGLDEKRVKQIITDRLWKLPMDVYILEKEVK